MKVTKEDLPQREVLLNIEVEDMALYLQRAYQRVVKRANVPGFRKGKAPADVIERFVGRDRLLEEAVDCMLPEVVEYAIDTEQIERGGAPRVEVIQNDPAVIKVTVPLTPVVSLNAYRDIRIQPELVDVKAEEVQETLEHLQMELAPWEPVDQPVSEGDQVTMDVSARIDNREVINQNGIVYLAHEDNPSPVPGFAKALHGLEPGKRTEFTISIPEDYPDPSAAGNECAFQVTIHGVKEKRLMELNDEFAKGVGEGYDSLDDLNVKLRGDIVAHKEQLARRNNEEKVLEELLVRTEIEISPMLVDHEIDHMLRDEQEALKRQQVGIEEYLETVGKSPEDHREEVRNLALAKLTRVHALRNVANLENLTATDEDVNDELSSMLGRMGAQAEALRRNLDTPDGRDSLSQIILNRKVMERLLQIGTGELQVLTAPTHKELDEEKGPGGS